jgi:hypothetical protein
MVRVRKPNVSESYVTRIRENRSTYKILIGKPQQMRPLWRPRGKWKDNIKINLKQIRLDSVVWIHLNEDGEQSNERSGPIKRWEFLEKLFEKDSASRC